MSWSESVFDGTPDKDIGVVEGTGTSSSRRPSWAPGAVLLAQRSGKKWIQCRRASCESKILFVDSPRGKPTPIECVGKYPDGTPIFEMHADNCVDAGNTGGYEPRISHRTTAYRQPVGGRRRREQSIF